MYSQYHPQILILHYLLLNLNLNLNLVRGKPKDASAIDVNLEKYKEAVQKIEYHVMKGKVRSFNHFFGKIAFIKDMIMRRLIANTVKFGYQIPCLAGNLNFLVLNNLCFFKYIPEGLYKQLL